MASSVSASPLFEDLYTFWVFSIKMPFRNKHAMFFLCSNTYQNVLLSERYLQPSLPFFWSKNTYETPHTCCFRFVSFGHSSFFLDLKNCWCIFVSHLEFLHCLLLFIGTLCPVDINDFCNLTRQVLTTKLTLFKSCWMKEKAGNFLVLIISVLPH